MDILSDLEIDNIVSKSKLAAKYNTPVDSQSAYEILTEKLKAAEERTKELEADEQREKEEKKPGRTRQEKGFFDDPVVKSMARTAGNTIVRSLLGALGIGGRRKKLF